MVCNGIQLMTCSLLCLWLEFRGEWGTVKISSAEGTFFMLPNQLCFYPCSPLTCCVMVTIHTLGNRQHGYWSKYHMPGFTNRLQLLEINNYLNTSEGNVLRAVIGVAGYWMWTNQISPIVDFTSFVGHYCIYPELSGSESVCPCLLLLFSINNSGNYYFHHLMAR